MSPDKLLAVVVLVSLTFGAGLQVERDHLVAIFKNVGLLGRALLANFVIVPVLGVLIAKLFRLPPLIATGFLLMAIAPGVPFILSNVRKRGGSLGFAVELVFFLPLLSVVTVPFTARLVLPIQERAELPLGHFLVTLLLFQLLPLLLGIVVAGLLPAAAAKLERVFHVLFLLSVLALVVLFAPKLVKDVAAVYGSNGMLAMLCMAILSLLTGWVLGGPARETRRILGIGTALRNIGLCAVVATTSFKETQIASAVLTYLLIQFVVTSIAGIYFTRTAERAPA
jgi:BASS family bile acid:Na+ symporter